MEEDDQLLIESMGELKSFSNRFIESEATDDSNMMEEAIVHFEDGMDLYIQVGGIIFDITQEMNQNLEGYQLWQRSCRIKIIIFIQYLQGGINLDQDNFFRIMAKGLVGFNKYLKSLDWKKTQQRYKYYNYKKGV